MKIDKSITGDTLLVKLEGRLDTKTSPELEESLQEETTDIIDIRMDFENLVYLSSAGLRVLLKAHKAQKARQGKVIVTNVNDTVMEVLEMTGFADILVIE